MTERYEVSLHGPTKSFSGDANIDRLYAMLLSLAAEVAALSEGLDTVRRLLERGGVIEKDAFATFEPNAVEAAERDRQRKTLVDNFLRPLDTEAERLLKAAASAP
jgi:hypothetical protein